VRIAGERIAPLLSFRKSAIVLKSGLNFLISHISSRFRAASFSKGDMVVSCFTSYGTFFGEFQGTPSSGRRVSVRGVDIFQIRDGKITEVRAFYDTYDQMQQLGLIPSLEASGR
jgi:hypothetical protein